jgi:hypothetical protein
MSAPDAEVKTLECAKCGADVRPDSQFCYNCGGPVAAEDAMPENGTPPKVDEKIERSTLPAPGLRSARDIRRERSFKRKPREIVWEPIADSGREGILLLITGAIVLFTVIVIFLAFYLH